VVHQYGHDGANSCCSQQQLCNDVKETDQLSLNTTFIYVQLVRNMKVYYCINFTQTEFMIFMLISSVIGRIFGLKDRGSDPEVTKFLTTKLYYTVASPVVIRVFKPRRIKWTGLIALMWEIKNAYRIFTGEHDVKRRDFTFCWPCIMQWFLVNDQRDAQISFYVFIFIYNSLHVSSTSCSSSGETNCINTTSGNCHFGRVVYTTIKTSVASSWHFIST
jgi:hypothetical protein